MGGSAGGGGVADGHAVIGLGLDTDIPVHLSKRQVTNKAINSFLENVRSKKMSYSRKPSSTADAEVHYNADDEGFCRPREPVALTRGPTGRASGCAPLTPLG